MPHITDSEATTHVLEFELGSQRYCVDITRITEIVDSGDLATIPGTDEHVRGVMDLRGTTTTIIDPKTLFDVEDAGSESRIIVFKGTETGQVGWLVDEVFQVNPVDETTVDDSVTDEGVHGVVRREDGFLIWVSPDQGMGS
jgi:purine-binding chemotaxis protein CheW